MTDTPDPARPARLAYPAAEPRLEAVEYGGIRYQDPFRWLEDSDPEALAWQSAQDALAQAQLAALPTREAFTRRLVAIGETEDVSAPVFAGGRWFRKYVPADQNLAVVEMSESPTAPGRRIIDLNAMRTDEPLQLQGFFPSPDGRKAVFLWAAAGREEPHARIINVDTGAVLLDGLPHKQPTNFAWFPDNKGVFYAATEAALAGETPLYRVDLASPGEVKPQAVTVDHPVVRPIAAADRRHIMLSVNHLAPRPQFIFDTQSDKDWQPFLKDIPGIFRGDILGENFLAITDDGAPLGRLVSIPLATPTQRETWQEIVPAGENFLAFVLVSGDRAVLLDWVDTYSRLRVIGSDGKFEGEIVLPGRGMVNSFGSHFVLPNIVDPIVRADDGQILFVFSVFGEAPILCRADLATREVVPLTEPKYRVDTQVLDIKCTSADGAQVLYHAVARADLDLSQPHPTVITGYGGFNVSAAPAWLGTQWAAWMEAGGVVVLAHLRGGGEYGTPWWEQGRLKFKQNSFNDVHAIAGDLIARGITTAGQLGVTGGSNGGVMASAVAVQRPDLYRASVPVVPITDVLARVRDPITMVSTLDYGDPADPEMAAILYAWSPYQNVRDDLAYPALLIDCGANDPRCPPWHGRKFAARVQQANIGDLPVLLRVRADAGHGAVGKDQRLRQSAETLAFFAEHLGLAV